MMTFERDRELRAGSHHYQPGNAVLVIRRRCELDEVKPW